MLFFGTADIMRRQVIPPITRYLRMQNGHARSARLLDVGCGTGRTLHQLACTHPGLSMVGVDLSPYYVELAGERLSAFKEVSVLPGNAEELPFRDGWFDVATSVFLLHELPRSVRRRVLAELHRVVRPGGLVVVEDS